MRALVCMILSSSLCFILCSSCLNKREDSLLLQKYEYKLWRILDDDTDKDSIEWINLGNLQIESFWEEYEWYSRRYDIIQDNDQGYDYDYASYIKISEKGMELPRRFKTKGYVPEYLYLDRDGYACMLFFDRNAGSFVEKQDSEMTGYWKLKNDSVMIINNNRYLFSKTGKNPDTVRISNMQTGSNIKIVDAGFYLSLPGHNLSWTDEDEKSHRKKWGFGIKQNHLLQGYDYRIWREAGNLGFYDPDEPILSAGNDYFVRRYYYCMFMYLDKYGRYADFALAGDKWHNWRMREHGYPNINIDDLEFIGDWYPLGIDFASLPFKGTFSITYTHRDTLHLKDAETGQEVRYIAVNLPPKNKWEKIQKR